MVCVVHIFAIHSLKSTTVHKGKTAHTKNVFRQN